MTKYQEERAIALIANVKQLLIEVPNIKKININWYYYEKEYFTLKELMEYLNTRVSISGSLKIDISENRIYSKLYSEETLKFIEEREEKKSNKEIKSSTETLDEIKYLMNVLLEKMSELTCNE